MDRGTLPFCSFDEQNLITAPGSTIVNMKQPSTPSFDLSMSPEVKSNETFGLSSHLFLSVSISVE